MNQIVMFSIFVLVVVFGVLPACIYIATRAYYTAKYDVLFRSIQRLKTRQESRNGQEAAQQVQVS